MTTFLQTPPSGGTTQTNRWMVSTYPLRMYPPAFVERNPGWKPTSLLFEADDCNIVALNLDPEECLELASALIRAANERKRGTGNGDLDKRDAS